MRRYIWSDLHLGHKSITKYRPQFSSAEEHDNYVWDKLRSVDHKRDMVFLLGDIAFSPTWLEKIKELKSRTILICGNHDLDVDPKIKMKHLVEAYDEVYSFYKYKDFWLSHAPVHNSELRGRRNIHGHTHRVLVRNKYLQIDKNYINVCQDFADSPLPFDYAVSDDYYKHCIKTKLKFLTEEK